MRPHAAPLPSAPGFAGRRAPLLMGVLNVTPDSFSDGGSWVDPAAAAAGAEAMVAAGAGIIDIGGESTRPGADPVPEQEELARVIPVLEAVRHHLDTPLSIDTRKAAVARAALDAGADWVNDISALGDQDMAPLCAQRGCPLVLMHMRGEPGTMQKDVHYTDPVAQIRDWLGERVALALQAGVAKSNLLLDPGIGFGKRLQDNLAIMGRLDEFHALGLPLLVGTSRKSFIGQVLDRDVDSRLHGTSATVAAAVLAGAQVIRVHDVEAMNDVARMAAAIRDGGVERVERV